MEEKAKLASSKLSFPPATRKLKFLSHALFTGPSRGDTQRGLKNLGHVRKTNTHKSSIWRGELHSCHRLSSA